MPKQYEPLRWSLPDSSKEFTIDQKTLVKRLTAASIQAADDGKYSTGQICAAVYGDLAGEKLGKARADREAAEVNAAKAKESAVLAEDADATLADYGTAVRSAIESARYLSEDQRAKLLAIIHDIEIDPAPAPDGTPRKTKKQKP